MRVSELEDITGENREKAIALYKAAKFNKLRKHLSSCGVNSCRQTCTDLHLKEWMIYCIEVLWIT